MVIENLENNSVVDDLLKDKMLCAESAQIIPVRVDKKWVLYFKLITTKSV